MIKVHIIEEYPDSFKFIGYVDQKPFVAIIEKSNYEITDLKYVGSVRSVVVQNAIVQCCVYTLINGLVKPRHVNPVLETRNTEKLNELALSILKRYGKQGVADSFRENVVAS